MSLAHRIDVRPHLRPAQRADYLTAKATERDRYAVQSDSFEALFTTHYPAIRRARAEAMADNARALVTFVYNGVPRFRSVHFVDGARINAFVLGSSPRAHVSIPSRYLDERHALIQVSLRGSETRIRCTGLAGRTITVENQAPARDIRSSGELFARIGDVAMFVFPLGPASSEWPPTASQAWRALPVRIVRGGEVHRIAVADNMTVLAIARQTNIIELGRGAPDTTKVTSVSATDGGDVSRIHAVIVRDGDGYVLHDAGSRHGTFVDGEQVTTVRLPKRCTIRLALGTTLTWHSER